MRSFTIGFVAALLLAIFAGCSAITSVTADGTLRMQPSARYLRHKTIDVHFTIAGQKLAGGTLTVTQVPALEAPTATYVIRWGYARVQVAEGCDSLDCRLVYNATAFKVFRMPFIDNQTFELSALAQEGAQS